MKTVDIAKSLNVSEKNVTLYKGVYTVRVGFFYTHGYTSRKLVDKVLAAFPNATIVDNNEIWKAFRGGAALKDQSHWYVKFTLPKD